MHEQAHSLSIVSLPGQSLGFSCSWSLGPRIVQWGLCTCPESHLPKWMVRLSPTLTSVNTPPDTTSEKGRGPAKQKPYHQNVIPCYQTSGTSSHMTLAQIDSQRNPVFVVIFALGRIIFEIRAGNGFSEQRKIPLEKIVDYPILPHTPMTSNRCYIVGAILQQTSFIKMDGSTIANTCATWKCPGNWNVTKKNLWCTLHHPNNYAQPNQRWAATIFGFNA